MPEQTAEEIHAEIELELREAKASRTETRTVKILRPLLDRRYHDTILGCVTRFENEPLRSYCDVFFLPDQHDALEDFIELARSSLIAPFTIHVKGRPHGASIETATVKDIVNVRMLNHLLQHQQKNG